MLELTQKQNVELFIGNNVEALEEILNQRAQEYFTMQKEKEKYNFGQNLTPERLRNLSKEIILDIKDFLKVTDTSSVYLSMFHLSRDLKKGSYIGLGTFTVLTLAELTNGLTVTDLKLAGSLALAFGAGSVIDNMREHTSSVFNKKEKIIRIGEKKEVNAAGGIAHEYTHHLQYSVTNLPMEEKNPIVEGHARGVEGKIVNNFAQRYDNPAYVFDHTDSTSKELKYAYLFICRKKEINPKESLANLPIPKVGGLLYKFFGHHYSIGVAAMSIAEAQYGNKVYSDVMNDDISFLKT